MTFSGRALIDGPDAEPLSLTEAKAQLRVTASDDDTYITSLIVGARVAVEKLTGRALITQQWELYLTRFPACRAFELPFGKLQSAEELAYTDEAGDETVVATSTYGADVNSQPGLIYLKPSQYWPNAALWPVNAVKITATFGYGDAGSDVPEPIKHAMKLLITDWYLNRTDQLVTSAGQTSVKLPRGVDSLVALYDIRGR